MLDKIGKGGGDAAKMAATMQQGITKAAAEARSAWQNMLIAIGKSVEFITIPLLNLVKSFAEWVKAHPWIARTIGLFMLVGTVLLHLVTIVGVAMAAMGSATSPASKTDFRNNNEIIN